jgi:hypothetical protein
MTYSVTIVVQHICEPYRKPYRVVVYSQERNYGKVEFDSLNELRAALQLALPTLAEQVPTAEMATDHTHVILSSEVAMTDSQLSLIGFLP